MKGHPARLRLSFSISCIVPLGTTHPQAFFAGFRGTGCIVVSARAIGVHGDLGMSFPRKRESSSSGVSQTMAYGFLLGAGMTESQQRLVTLREVATTAMHPGEGVPDRICARNRGSWKPGMSFPRKRESSSSGVPQTMAHGFLLDAGMTAPRQCLVTLREAATAAMHPREGVPGERAAECNDP